MIGVASFTELLKIRKPENNNSGVEKLFFLEVSNLPVRRGARGKK
jgi:hypothetical protein